MTRFTHTFALISGLAMLAAALALTFFLHSASQREGLDLTEKHNVALARALANSMQAQIDALITGPGPADTKPGAMTVADFHRVVATHFRDLSVIKVKIYNPAGLTVFSSEAKQIGEIKSDNAGFRQAMAGRVASELTHRNQFSAFEGVIEDRDVLSTYIPIYNDTTAQTPASVFEIYYDATAFLKAIADRQTTQALVIFSVFTGIYILLLFVARRADAMAREHHDAALASAAAAARAESANRTKSEFLANMSHELRTPLNAVLGFADIIRRQMFGTVGSPRYASYAEDIFVAANHLLAIINDILDLARVEAGKIDIQSELLHLDAFTEHALGMVRTEAEAGRIVLTRELDPGVATMETDERLLQQIVLNLLTNAIKFTPPGGTVRLSVQAAASGRIAIQVSDTGIGIKKEDIPKALAPFSQIENSMSRRHQGTGLGLSLAQRFSKALGGRLVIESEPGRGTTVVINLPARLSGSLQSAA